MKETALEINGLSKKIGDRIILSDINLSVKAGDICGIVGRNASGKSMLFKCITNLVTYDSLWSYYSFGTIVLIFR